MEKEKTNFDLFGEKLHGYYHEIAFSNESSNLKRENANINSDTPMGKMLKFGSESEKEFVKHYVLPDRFANAHASGDIHIHDLDFYATGTLTCCQIDIDALFERGFSTGHGFLRTPNDIISYAALTCIAIQSNQNDQHGGQSVPNFDYALAKGVAKTFVKEYKLAMFGGIEALEMMKADSDLTEYDKIKSVVEHIIIVAGAATNSEPRLTMSQDYLAEEARGFMSQLGYDLPTVKKIQEYAYKIAERETNKKTHQAMEALIHNLNTMQSRAGSQVPFSSINYGTCTSAEGRMVIQNILLATQEGLGKGETAIFPVQVFKVKEGINYNPDDPNYDLFRLAMETSAQRLFPNFEFLDAPFNLQYYKEGHPETEVATMGCVDGQSLIVIAQSDDNDKAGLEPILLDFNDLWDQYAANRQYTIEKFGRSQYIEPSDLYIFDSSRLYAEDESSPFVRVKKIIKNPNRDNWYRIAFSNGRFLLATADHPLPILGKGRTFVENVEVGDEVMVSLFDHNPNSPDITSITSIKMVDNPYPSYDVETESDFFDVNGINSHNCRTRVMGNYYDPDREIAYGRGNLSFTTINLPRLAIEAEGDLDLFFEKLQDKLELCCDQLDERVELQRKMHVYNFPMLMGQGVWIDSVNLKNNDEIGDIIYNGSLSVGFIGLAETLKALVGAHHGESEEAQALGLKIIGFMRNFMNNKAEATHKNYTLLATPAEGLSGRFISMDRDKYGIIEGVTDREYYTNSFHVPVYHDICAYDKISLEAPYHSLCNAGHISYVELDGMPSKNMDAYESVIRCMHDAGIGYGSVNFPLDIDPICGYRGIIREGDRCPKCGRDENDTINGERHNFTRIRRVTGYLSGDYKRRFNSYKQAEVRDRVKHGFGTKQ